MMKHENYISRNRRKRLAIFVYFLFDSFQDVHGYIVINDNISRRLRIPQKVSSLNKEETILSLPNNDGMNTQTIQIVNEPTMGNSEGKIESLSLLSRPLAFLSANQFAATTMTTQNTDTKASTFSPLESWSMSKLDRWYSSSQSIKCPFFRRRYGDSLDMMEGLMKHTIIRKECWHLMGAPQAHRPAGTNNKLNKVKYKGLSPKQLQNYILDDWKADTGKGYYITGKLTTAIYRDDTLFIGPDPDLPCSGLRKYVGVATHLFDYHASSAKLESLEMIQNNKNNIKTNNNKDVKEEEEEEETTIALVARWKLRGKLRLPWRPNIPKLSGKTIYHIDNEGLIFCHEESWDCSALEVFFHTFLPKIANRIWPNSSSNNNNDDDDDDDDKSERIR
jgi:flavodoxin